MVVVIMSESWQPACVHVGTNALNTPAVGWVTTTPCSILPEPTGMSEVLASTWPASGGGVGVFFGTPHAARGATATPRSSDRRGSAGVGILTG